MNRPASALSPKGPFAVRTHTFEARDPARERLFFCDIWCPDEPGVWPLVLYLLGPARSSAIWAGWAGANGARLNEPIGGDAVLTLHELLYFPLVIVRFADYHCSLRQMLTFTWTRTRLSATMLIEHRDVGPREPQPRAPAWWSAQSTACLPLPRLHRSCAF